VLCLSEGLFVEQKESKMCITVEELPSQSRMVQASFSAALWDNVVIQGYLPTALFKTV